MIDNCQLGSLLYHVPKVMQLGKNARCTIRLAFDKESLLKYLSRENNVTIEEIRISEVMQVELADPLDEGAFQVKSLSDKEQFVEEGDYSEWQFYVKPQIEGVHPLIIRIAVIEEIRGKERKKVIVLEELINIVTAATKSDDDPGFKQSGHSFFYSYTILPMGLLAQPDGEGEAPPKSMSKIVAGIEEFVKEQLNFFIKNRKKEED